jgi:hypothetical protein
LFGLSSKRSADSYDESGHEQDEVDCAERFTAAWALLCGAGPGGGGPRARSKKQSYPRGERKEQGYQPGNHALRQRSEPRKRIPTEQADSDVDVPAA